MDTFDCNKLYHQLQVLEKEEESISAHERLASLVQPLLFWYEKRARSLPWRERPEPYRVWISEIMLQQTRVEAVKPYFERFMQALPEVRSLAEVSEEQLLKLWEGLGYYNRARNLKKAAIAMMEQHQGRLPDTYEELIDLPGIGSYTAGAIASIAYGAPLPAVDGNVLRVLSRVLASKRDILKQSTKKWMETELQSVIPADDASRFNQALIEIGALVCLPNGSPRCEECPMHSLCLARKKGLILEIPVKTPKKKRRIEEITVLLLEDQHHIALHKREASGLLASLYEFPNVPGYLTEDEVWSSFGLTELRDNSRIEELPDAKHIFTHVEWHMRGYHIHLDKSIPETFLSVKVSELKEQYAIPNAFNVYRKLLEKR